MKRYYLPAAAFVVVVAAAYASTFFRPSEPGWRDEKPHERSKGFTTNYASAYLGATLTDFSPECLDASSVLNEDNEKYMLCPCNTQRKYFTVQLIRGIEVRIMTLVSQEHFSSRVKNFTVLGSSRYPTNEWRVLGHFKADPWRGTQHFDVANQQPVRFLRFLWATSYGEHSWCALTTFKVFGVDVLETLTEDYTVSVEEQQQHEQEQEHSIPPTPLTEPLIIVSPPQDDKHTAIGIDYGTSGAGVTAAVISTVEDHHETNSRSPGGGLLKHSNYEGNLCVDLNGCKDDGSKTKKCNGTTFNSMYLDTIAQRYCSTVLPPENASRTCLPHERNLYVIHLLSFCVSRVALSNKITALSKPHTSSSVLLMLAQMSKQIKTLQQEVVDLNSRHKDMELKAAQREITLQWLGMQVKDFKRSNNENRDKLQDVMKQIEVLKSKLSLQLHLGQNCEDDSLVRVMVVGSLTLSLFSSVLSCITVRTFYRPRRRTSATHLG
ncbi:Sad1 / UNC-like C-terminal, putative [Trypanosoma equiperdum]|uniref:SUN domain-containing protein n=2 Tax=Trypanozoon TaxID=39700 RepID=Q585N7_TRYB2|nr:hypothetical protein, conserved [Trypanosoma brucei brucei TREU927]AAX79690.1 hypothetical protein, conserved [Trypanosoma brucei]AAZ11736.1 hypothetical protein, conserved [Trypanosoma brucei brucei TREU927]SCU73248.1 Sad1 / UNC-like C-terminal, putative [Trypanosoma equiperdum]